MADETTPERYSNFTNCLAQLHNWQNIRVIVIDFGSQFQYPTLSHELTVKYEHQPFNARLAKNIGAKLVNDGDIIFMLDADMLALSELENVIQQSVDDNCAYFPVCYSLNKDKPALINGDHRNGNANGWWRTSGYGIYAIKKSLFMQAGQDDFENNSWGGDEVFYNRVQNVGQVLRNKSPYLFHQWHPDSQNYKNRFYSGKSKYE